MAFVFKAERILNEQKGDAYKNIGPGSYVGHEDRHFAPLKAPFLSKTKRVSPTNPKVTPGPGDYDVEPLTDGQKIVLQSGASEVKVLEVPKPSYVFKSQSQRFLLPQLETQPGPGQYFTDDHLQLSPKGTFQQNSKNIIQELAKLGRYQSIPSIPNKNRVYGYTEKDNQLELNKPIQTITTGIKDDVVGPGQYESKDTFDGKKGAQWSKSKVAKVQEVIHRDNEPEVGPGTYEIDQNPVPYHKKKPDQPFMSKDKRMFDQGRGQVYQEFQYERLRSKQHDFLGKGVEDSDSFEVEYIDDTTPGPGHYSVQSTTMSTMTSYNRSESSFAFGTRQSRFKQENKPNVIGPGDYQLMVQTQKIQPPDIQKPPFNSSDTRFAVQKIEKKPGPQHYTLKETLEEDLKRKLRRGPLGNFGTNIDRFKLSEFQDQVPGPGTYEIKGIKPPSIGVQSTFKSATTRDPFKSSMEEIPPPYDVENFNIEKRVRVEQEEDPDLQVKKPPFLIGVPRFSETVKVIPEEDDDDRLIPRKDINDFFMKKPKQSAPFLSTDKRFKYKVKDKTPAPGEHQDLDHITSWNKRTFNILFAEI